jgi:hypothetical protein
MSLCKLKRGAHIYRKDGSLLAREILEFAACISFLTKLMAFMHHMQFLKSHQRYSALVLTLPHVWSIERR